MDVAERFFAKVNKNAAGGCWEWTASKDRHGYGQFGFYHGKIVRAHRWSYEHYKGSIPEELHLDHLCRNRKCVNPEHLEPVTNQENVLRGVTIAAENAQKTHCPQGHLYNQENVYVSNGRRYCRECNRIRLRARRVEKRNARKAGQPSLFGDETNKAG